MPMDTFNMKTPAPVETEHRKIELLSNNEFASGLNTFGDRLVSLTLAVRFRDDSMWQDDLQRTIEESKKPIDPKLIEEVMTIFPANPKKPDCDYDYKKKNGRYRDEDLPKIKAYEDACRTVEEEKVAQFSSLDREDQIKWINHELQYVIANMSDRLDRFRQSEPIRETSDHQKRLIFLAMARDRVETNSLDGVSSYSFVFWKKALEGLKSGLTAQALENTPAEDLVEPYVKVRIAEEKKQGVAGRYAADAEIAKADRVRRAGVLEALTKELEGVKDPEREENFQRLVEEMTALKKEAETVAPTEKHTTAYSKRLGDMWDGLHMYRGFTWANREDDIADFKRLLEMLGTTTEQVEEEDRARGTRNPYWGRT